MIDPLLAGAGALLFLVFASIAVVILLKRWQQRPARVGNGSAVPAQAPSMPNHTNTTTTQGPVHLYSAHPSYEYTPNNNLLVKL